MNADSPAWTQSCYAALSNEHKLIDEGIQIYLAIAQHPADRRRDALIRAVDLLRRHIHFEERYLFPPLRALGLGEAVLAMSSEHALVQRDLGYLAAHLSDNYSIPGATATTVCSNLLAQLESHNFKEENVVYRQAHRLLPPADQAELRRIHANVMTPGRWIDPETGGV